MNLTDRLRKELQSDTGLYEWRVSDEYKQEVKVIKKAGRPKGSGGFNDYNRAPRTPFEALRILLRMTRKEWAEVVDISQASVAIIERGAGLVNIAIVKRMQEEARKRGIAVTLDELLMHVVPWGKEAEAQSVTNIAQFQD